MQIKHMKSEDLEAVAELAIQLGYPNSVEEIRSRFKRMENLTGYVLFVAKNPEGQIVGWIQANQEAASLLVPPRIEIAALVVDKDHRGQGVGSALLKKAQDWARANGAQTVRVRSNVAREAAHRFYQREGYELQKTGHIFIKDF